MPAPRALFGCLLAIALGLTPAAASAAEPTRSSSAFVDSIGVMVHMTYLDTAYRDRDRLVNKLDEAGIRHVRDGLSWDTQYAYDSFNQLADRGIKTTFIMGDPSERRDTLEELISTLKNKVPRAVAAVEGPNEYSYSGDRQWAPHLRHYQSRLYSSVKQDPALRHLPILAPSLISPQDHFDLGDLRDSIDFGNKHSYPSADIPEGNVDEELATAAKVSGERPVYVTESGYHNALNTDSGHRPISEAGAATYLPRMYLEYFRRGIPRTFAYELIDEWPDPAKRNLEANFGLLRNDYSEKPAFRSLSNLISVLADPGGGHPTQPLEYSVGNAPPDLRRLLLQRRDGSYSLVLWRATRVWDPVARRPVASNTVPVTVDVGGVPAGGQRAQLISPARSTAPYASAAVEEAIPIALGADPVVVRLPALNPAPPTPDVISIPPRQQLRTVARRGVLVRCRSRTQSSCRATAKRRGGVIGRGHGRLDGRRTVAVRVRPTRRGRRVLRRARGGRSGRTVAVKVQARFGRGDVITRRVVLRR